MNTQPTTKPLVVVTEYGITYVGSLDETSMMLENPAKVLRQYGQRPSHTIRGAMEGFTALNCCAPNEFLSTRAMQIVRSPGLRIMSVDEDMIAGERKELLAAYEQWMQALAQLRAQYSGIQTSGIVLPVGAH